MRNSNFAYGRYVLAVSLVIAIGVLLVSGFALVASARDGQESTIQQTDSFGSCHMMAERLTIDGESTKIQDDEITFYRPGPGCKSDTPSLICNRVYGGAAVSNSCVVVPSQ